MAIDAVAHLDAGRVLAVVTFFGLLEHVDHVLRRAVVKTVGRTAVALANLVRRKLAITPAHRHPILGLRVVGSPAEVAGGDKAGVGDGAKLEGEPSAGEKETRPHREQPL